MKKLLSIITAIALLLSICAVQEVFVNADAKYDVYNNSAIKLQGRAFEVGASSYNGTKSGANNSVCLPWGGDGVEFTAVTEAETSLKIDVCVGGVLYAVQFTAFIGNTELGTATLVTGTQNTSDANHVSGDCTTSDIYLEYTVNVANIPAGTNVIRLIRQDGENLASRTFLKSVSFSGTLGACPANGAYKIDVIGDSISAGHGVYGGTSQQEVSGNIYNSDITRSWGYLTAQGLNSDYAITALSGVSCTNMVKGGHYSKWSSMVRNTDYNPARKADIALVNLYTNWDGSSSNQTMEERAKVFTDNAIELANQIRKVNGDEVKIVWVYNLCGTIAIQENAILSLKTGGYIDDVVKVTANREGGNGHPSVSGQFVAANEVLSFLSMRFGYSNNGIDLRPTTATTMPNASSSASTSDLPTSSSSASVETSSKTLMIDWDTGANKCFSAYSLVGTPGTDCLAVNKELTSGSTIIASMYKFSTFGFDINSYAGLCFSVTVGSTNTATALSVRMDGNYSTKVDFTLSSGVNEITVPFDSINGFTLADSSSFNLVLVGNDKTADMIFSNIFAYKNIEKLSVSVDGVSSEFDKGSEFVLPNSAKKGFICYTDGMSLYNAGDMLTVEKNLIITSIAIDLQMQNGAAMRYNTVSGMRYNTKVDTTAVVTLKNAGATVVLGTLIAPADYFSEGDELTLDFEYAERKSAGKSSYLNVLYEADEWYEDGQFVGSIANILDSNAKRAFVGRGYAAVSLFGKTTIVYADYSGNIRENNSRSIGWIAGQVKGGGEYAKLSAEQKDIVDRYYNLYLA